MTRLLATRTQVVLLVLALVAALGVLGAIGWVTWSARAAASVSADWRPACAEARVGNHEGEPAIWSRPTSWPARRAAFHNLRAPYTE